MTQLTEAILRECFIAMIEERVGDAAERILDRAQRGDRISFFSVAQELDEDPVNLLLEFQSQVYEQTGQVITPKAYFQ